MADKYFAGMQGKVFIATRDSNGVTGGYEYIGDADALEITGSQNFLDFRESNSGTMARVVHVPVSTDLGFRLQMRNIDGPNLARAFYGTTASSAGASVTGEAINAYAGKMVALKHPGVSAVTVTKTSGSTLLVAGTDYVLDAVNGTLTFLSTSTNVTGSSAVPCTVNYTYAAYASKTQGLVETIKDYKIRAQLKDLVTGKAVIVEMHRANMNLAPSLALIMQDVGALEVEGALLPAAEINTAGESQYFTVLEV